MTSVPDNNRRPMVVFCLYFHLASFISVLKLNLQSVQMREESSLGLFFTSILDIYKGGLFINELLKQTLIFHKWHKLKTKAASQQQQKERKVRWEKESKRGWRESHIEKVPFLGNWILFYISWTKHIWMVYNSSYKRVLDRAAELETVFQTPRVDCFRAIKTGICSSRWRQNNSNKTKWPMSKRLNRRSPTLVCETKYGPGRH